MILVDFSSIFHRMAYSAIKGANPPKVDGIYVTDAYAPLVISSILEELFSIEKQYSGEFNDMVLCFDDASKKYWRTDVYPEYKASRKVSRAKSEINFKELFIYMNRLIIQLKENLPWKCIDIPKAEADDIILVLAKEYCNSKILIHSPDKDFLQSQRHSSTIKQWSSLTKKWLVPEHKSESMEDWIQEHCMLGDVSDGVPKVVDFTEFSESFKLHLSRNNVDSRYFSPYNFKHGYVENSSKYTLTEDEKINAMRYFDITTKNKMGEVTGLDVYKKIRFGPSTLAKKIKEYGTLDNYLDSHPMYREHYDRNYTLVMEEGIPDYIRNDTLLIYTKAKNEYNKEHFTEYLNDLGLINIITSLSIIFPEELTAESCGW